MSTRSGAGAPAGSSPAAGDTSGAVNASLRSNAVHRSWDLLSEVTSRHGLWLALLLIVLVGRWAFFGFLRDAYRRSRAVRPT
jgi:hypothetical protein